MSGKYSSTVDGKSSMQATVVSVIQREPSVESIPKSGVLFRLACGPALNWDVEPVFNIYSFIVHVESSMQATVVSEIPVEPYVESFVQSSVVLRLACGPALTWDKSRIAFDCDASELASLPPPHQHLRSESVP